MGPGMIIFKHPEKIPEKAEIYSQKLCIFLNLNIVCHFLIGYTFCTEREAANKAEEGGDVAPSVTDDNAV